MLSAWSTYGLFYTAYTSYSYDPRSQHAYVGCISNASNIRIFCKIFFAYPVALFKITLNYLCKQIYIIQVKIGLVITLYYTNNDIHVLIHCYIFF